MPANFLRLSGWVLAGACLALYLDADYSPLALVLLALAPDMALLVYVVGPRAGAVAYNLAHAEALPIALGALGVLAGGGAAVQVALIWLGHIGVDNGLGYGLKYPTRLTDHHLQRV